MRLSSVHESKDLYVQVLGITPWSVQNVELNLETSDVVAHLGPRSLPQAGLPELLQLRAWLRHQEAALAAPGHLRIPYGDRGRHPADQLLGEHCIHQSKVPWSEPNSGFTARFEALAFEWMKEACC